GFWILDDINPLRQVTPDITKQSAVLFKPSDPIRGVYNLKVQYYLQNKLDSVKIEILDAQDKVISTHAGTQPEYKTNPNIPWWMRGGSTKPTTGSGVNEFTWDLRYPGATVFDGIIIWSGRPQRGPAAPPGDYKVRLTAGSYTATHPFKIKMNPNLQGVTEADLKETYELSIKIRDKESEANEAVIKIRDIKKKLDAATASVDPATTAAAKDFAAKLTVIENDLYQTKNQSGQDPLNFPIKLNNRLSSLRRSVETGDGKPTDGAYKVFDELSKELEGHLSKLNVLLNGDLPSLNQKLGLDEVKK
ncbi:MAG: glycosyl hydrolase, partial [Cyclobacteriaceae bacterium]|nr:glycosyl hydrolase [Cyclobacteriaceae bacterium]